MAFFNTIGSEVKVLRAKPTEDIVEALKKSQDRSPREFFGTDSKGVFFLYEGEDSKGVLGKDLNRGLLLNGVASPAVDDKNLDSCLRESLGEKNVPAVYKFYGQSLSGVFSIMVQHLASLTEEFYKKGFYSFAKSVSRSENLYQEEGKVYIKSLMFDLVLEKPEEIKNNGRGIEPEKLVKLPGVVETTFQLDSETGRYYLKEMVVSNSLLKELSISEEGLSLEAIEKMVKAARKEEKKNLSTLKRIQVSEDEKQKLSKVGIKNVGQFFGSLQSGELPNIAAGALRVQYPGGKCLHTVVGLRKLEDFSAIALNVKDDHGEVRFYVRTEGKYNPGDCVLSNSEDQTIAASIEMLEKISKTIDISELPVKVEEEKDLSPKALAWLTCQAKGVVPYQDQARTPVKLDDLVPEGGGQEAVKLAMQRWVEQMPNQTQPEKEKHSRVEDALKALTNERHGMTMRNL